MALIDKLKDEQKLAMKAKDKARLGTIRLALSAIKQREVDERITLIDEDILGVLTKMVKQRRDSVAQYEAASRQDLADAEKAEITVLEDFMPQPLTDDEVAALIDAAISEANPAGMQDMGKVMGVLKPQIQGRADMGKVSGLVRAKLA
ncbi:putative Aspartyl/glutamyl-tRNA amidotransferase subunit B [Vibrio nigripulchritudo SFn27]|uniref:Putative Aspartyl/glutamyl-tRNA amidotransferase subunit B n=1 Tax=Vibrio nigripulchritudo TaxID=28173 RepID=U4KEB3_9VIBR|nr:GatB/YqeY domain-containing protein [Vibrio nigripulchritudo]CCN84747.1 putative Aspartyl/glutamyl-tRNA amidotransferase subunit B [Vibrio nigripulchritudo BLFn1]CCN87761.1 putative Aspartyl/glutamyl-tRNA amidotransferase subunit B [Vibrio nigripulchritudo SFn27]CCN95744.1 putative Aspartyl/glutamyl-tRNA amidotransferase subunit B [Vibrio nigripulchritudo ENn2]CCO38900.1 putative Aspartyl/glutamyl-tRNA amidotransferase subunit B [Vibrio nigripulchritudo SFn135]CCO51860.1 putative Aspartyl/g